MRPFGRQCSYQCCQERQRRRKRRTSHFAHRYFHTEPQYKESLLRVKPGPFKEHASSRRMLDALGRVLEVYTVDEWYGVSVYDLQRYGGAQLLARFGASPARAVMAGYPELDWKPWNFSSVPKGYWDDSTTHRLFFDSISVTLGIDDLSQWYKVHKITETVNNLGGNGLLHLKYGGSAINALASVYPDYNWQSWKFGHVRNNHWDNIKHQQQFFDHVANLYGIESETDWSTVTVRNVRKLGGAGLLMKYDCSVLRALTAAYPDKNFDKKLFRISQRRPANRSDWTTARVIQYMRSLEKALVVKHPTDWYRISITQASEVAGVNMRWHYVRFLSILYPDYSWDKHLFSIRDKRSQQRLAVAIVTSILDDMPVYEEFALKELHGTICVDIYVPKLKLALEYQGEHHYFDCHGQFGSSLSQKARDDKRKRRLRLLGIAVEFIPYWWKGDHDTIAKLLSKYLPKGYFQRHNQFIGPAPSALLRSR